MKTTLPILPITLANNPPGSTTPKRDAAKRKIAELKAASMQFGGVDVDGANSEIYLDGDVGDAFNARDVREALKKLDGRKAKIFINSRGGTVTEGFAIFNAIGEYSGGCDTYCTFAASIASLIFQAGERRYMFPASLLMVHAPWLSMSGNSSEFEKQIEVLKKFEQQMIGVYQRRTGKTAAKIQQLISQETWMTDSEAIAEGFADAVVGSDAFTKAKTLTLAEARAKVAMLATATSRIDPNPMRTAAKSKMAKLLVEQDKLARRLEDDQNEW